MRYLILAFVAIFLLGATPPPKPKPPKAGKTKYKCARHTIDWSLQVAGYFTHGNKDKKRMEVWRDWLRRKENKRYLMMVSQAVGWLTARKPGYRRAAQFQLYVYVRIHCGMEALPQPGDPPLYQ